MASIEDRGEGIAPRKELVAAGKAREHHVLTRTGWVGYPVRGEEDMDGEIEPFRLDYERLVRRRRRSGEEEDEWGGQ